MTKDHQEALEKLLYPCEDCVDVTTEDCPKNNNKARFCEQWNAYNLVKQALEKSATEIAELKAMVAVYVDRKFEVEVVTQYEEIVELSQENKKLKAENTVFEEEATLCLKENKKLEELLKSTIESKDEEIVRLHECIDTYAKEAGDKPDN